MKNIYVSYSEGYLSYDFGPDHPMRPERLEYFIKLLESISLLKECSHIFQPEKASKNLLTLFHTEDYLQFVKESCSKGVGYLDSFDTPAFRGCFEAASLMVGGTLECVRRAEEGVPAFNVGGGYHHAYPDRASGFCIFNDVGVAVKFLESKNYRRILYFDMDAHHGDGVMYSFYDDPRLLCIDIHESGRYLFPGTGFENEIGVEDAEGLKVNIPLQPYSGDCEFEYILQEIVKPVVEWFKPEFIIMQCGGDSHWGDPITHLELSTYSYILATETLKEVAERYSSSRIVLLGGGGYNIFNTNRCWLSALATLLDISLPKYAPKKWLSLLDSYVHPYLLDRELTGREPGPIVKETVENLKELVLKPKGIV